MNITSLQLIDVGLVILVISLLFLIQGSKKKSSFSNNSSKKELNQQTTSIKLPDKETLLELESFATSKSSGIDFDSILGNWNFSSVWQKDNQNNNSFLSSLLRVFSANLELKKSPSIHLPFKLSIITSITFGLLSMEFSGYGYLKGKQPLLIFFFNLIQLKIGTKVLLSRCLNEPEENKKSIFKLIALGGNRKWLSARVQGSGLVLWLKD